ncbi:hypothetical protein PILCRDRAFT_10564 [Piloderma croceum F 1598]|uniref:Uncharacterized protein n=1 Tax=Piloderma croceum (strain F 1598) TaxID=765440 RepID=A0A0C3F322_PILCF|nr:hypothetical protein PILCRDRAFT_10564 [Piloderma croceum F 1598]
MALQPNIQIINQAALYITAELAKFPNIPALDQGNAILDAIRDLDTQANNRHNELIARIRAIDRNQIARLVNSGCTLPTSALTALLNAKTGAPIANFPATVANIQALTDDNSYQGQDVNRILKELDQDSTGTTESRRARLIRAVGVTMQVIGGA